MTLQECVAILAPVALACRAEVDEPTFRAYHRVLADVPAALAEAGLYLIIKSGDGFFPPAPKVLLAAEQARQQLIQAHPYEGCAECEATKGWTAISDGNVTRLQRCACFHRHQEFLAAFGATRPLALPAGSE
jgi:hypothetical protein